MSLMDAKSLFLRIRSCNDSTPADCISAPENQILDEILRELQCFLLAIDQAASFIRENSPMTQREYLGYPKPRTIDRERLMRFKEANPRYPESVMTTWEISLEYLEQSQPRASWILQVLGFLEHSHIAEILLTRTSEVGSWIFDSNVNVKRLPANLERDMRYLKNDVEFRVAICSLYVHPLVHVWIRVRLNAYPAQQARFAIAAATILYQSFPLELAAWLPVHFPTMSAETHSRINQVSHHLKNVVDNLRDYQIRTVTTPLECFTLLEAIYVTGLPNHSIYAFDLSEGFLVGLDRAIRVIISYLAQNQRLLAIFVHKVAAWLRIDSKLRKDVRIPNQIAESLESLVLMTPVEDTMAMFFMLFATVVIDCAKSVTDSVKNDEVLSRKVKHLEDPVSQHTKVVADVHERKDLHRRTSRRLLDGVFRLLAPFQRMSCPMRWIVFMVELRLLNTLSPAEFATREDLRIDLLLSPEAIGYLDFDHRANYLSQLTQLYWKCPWPKNYVAIKRLLALACSEGKVRLAHEQHQLEAQRGGDTIRRWSRNAYTSGSFGRSGDPSTKGNPTIDLITPLNYFWTIVLNVAEAVSDPNRYWGSEGGLRDDRYRLDLLQRKWALKLVSGTKKLYERILDEQGRDQSRTEAAFLQHFQHHDVIPTLMIIHMNLGDWAQVEAAVWDGLRYDNVLECYTKICPLPWEYRKTSAEVRSAVPVDPELARPQVPFPHSLEASEEIEFGQRMDASTKQPTLGVDTKITLESEKTLSQLQKRLEAVASERMAFNETFVAQRGEGRVLPILENLGIPLSCENLYTARVHDMLYVFIMLCRQKDAITEEGKNELVMQSEFITSMPRPASQCLGRLELIYRLARSYLLKVTRTEIGRSAPHRDWVGSQDDSPDSSNGERFEDTKDLSQTEATRGSADFEWEW